MTETSDGPSLSILEERLGYHFRDPELLQRALTHPSWCQHRAGAPEHNQRLEFLGDAVLSLILAEQLYEKLPRKREGVLTRNRSALAKGQHLSTLARELGLSGYIRMSEAEERNDGRQRDSMLEDALEAMIGAIYLDSDIQDTRTVVLRWVGDIEQRLDRLLDAHNPKGRLQELIQPLHGNNSIEYRLLQEEGPDHAKRFTVEVCILGEPAGTGSGSSKKEAEENAARVALMELETE